MLVEIEDIDGGKLTYGFRFAYPEPNITHNKPIRAFLPDGVDCPLGLEEFLEANSEVPTSKWHELVMGEVVIDVEPRKVLCLVDRITDSDGKRAVDPYFKTQAVCHPLDNFCKRVGRFIAFKRAVKIFAEILPQEILTANGGEREVKRKVWNRFHVSGAKMPTNKEMGRTIPLSDEVVFHV